VGTIDSTGDEFGKRGGLERGRAARQFRLPEFGRHTADGKRFSDRGQGGLPSHGAAGNFEPTAKTQRRAQSRLVDSYIRSEPEYSQFSSSGPDEHLLSGSASGLQRQGNLRFYVSYSQRKTNLDQTNTPNFPGGIDPTDYTSNSNNNRIAGVGIDWTVRPTLINQFHAGYMYQYSAFVTENKGIDLTKISQQVWNYGAGLYSNNGTYGSLAYPRLPISSFYPLLSANDNVNWQHGAHSVVVGGSWFREQDHYWNNPGGFPNYNFNISSQDPLGAVFASAFAGASTTNLTNAQNLYAELTGRIGGVNSNTGRPLDPATKQYKPYGQYNLDEVQSAWGIWFQDSWRLKPNLTFNYGLRWDFVGDDHDVNGGYSTLATIGDLWGPTPVGGMFSPGLLSGVTNPQFQAQVHAYNPAYMNPSPAVGIAWNPKGGDGFWGRLLGKNTVIRTGYSLRHYLEGAQNFWAYASNSGAFFYQGGTLNSNPAAGVGNFAPSSLTLGTHCRRIF
jgi:hypothetical protein